MLLQIVDRHHDEDARRINELISNLETKNSQVLEAALNKLFVNEKMHELQSKVLNIVD